ncbi:MAG: hypothetical protein ACFE8E_13565 [Candidatus Hodarchaeota archaeon]
MTETEDIKPEKIKCPMCGKKYVPQFFHREKMNYELATPIYRFKVPKFKRNNNHIRPTSFIRRSWVTYCPKCKYIIKFAAEVGKKELLADFSSFFHLKEFKENGGVYEYTFYNYDKPYNDILYYNKILLESLRTSIYNALEDLNLKHWGKLYKMWKKEKSIDSFKFLIRFYSYLLKSNQIQEAKLSNEKFLDKIEGLNISDNLKKRLVEIKQFRTKAIYEYYELTKDDEKFIHNVFIDLMFEMVINKLDYFASNNIYDQKNIDTIDRQFLYSEIKKVFSDYFEDQLGLSEFLNEFVISLMNKLKITL